MTQFLVLMKIVKRFDIYQRTRFVPNASHLLSIQVENEPKNPCLSR